MLPSCDNCKRSGCAYLHVTIAFDDDQKKASKSFHVLVASQSLLEVRIERRPKQKK
jgi:hypothetical protein